MLPRSIFQAFYSSGDLIRAESILPRIIDKIERAMAAHPHVTEMDRLLCPLCNCKNGSYKAVQEGVDHVFQHVINCVTKNDSITIFHWVCWVESTILLISKHKSKFFLCFIRVYVIYSVFSAFSRKFLYLPQNPVNRIWTLFSPPHIYELFYKNVYWVYKMQ